VFGKETVGFEKWILQKYSDQISSIPVLGKIRSLNLATAVAVVVYEGLRQIRRP
jgi:tRNA (cytidine/uridine-2'-O-)-methyltransferase